jgi:hypothetical protein
VASPVLLTGATGTLGRARRYLRTTGRRCRIAPLRVPGEVGAALRAGEDLAPLHADGRITFDQFLAASSDD